MSEAYLSEFEKIFLLHGVQDGMRLDGRLFNDYRPIQVEFEKINNCYGSCQLTLGETKLIATVKAEIDTPDFTTPNLGKLDFFVDCSANATPEFQGRGGEKIAAQIVNILTNLFSTKNFDLSQLCIVEGKKCWHLYIDIVLLEYCGNIYDACVLAVKFALNQSKLPALIVKSDDEGQIELDFSDNPSDLMTLDTNDVPYSVTVNKIGQYYVIDSDLKEESVTKVRTTIGFDSQGNIRFANKDGFGSLDPDTLYSIIDVAKSASKYLHEYYVKKIENQTAMEQS